MAAANAFTITITAADKASAVAKKIEAALGRVSRPIDRVTASAAKLNEATARVRKPFSDFGSSLKRLSNETGLTRVANGFRSIGESAADAGKSLLKVVAPLAGIAGLGSIAGIALLANEWGRMGAEVQRTSGVLGVSTSDLQAYRGAAKLAGLSADDMTGSLKSLGRTIEDATYGRNQDALVMMHKFGISLHRTKDGAVDATRALKEVANAIVAQKGNVQAQSVIAGAFGVESLLPLLQKGGAGIDEFVNRARSMGLVFDDKQLARSQQFNENILKLEASATRLKYSFGDALAPAVGKVLDVIGRLIDKYGDVIATKVSEYVERFAKWIDHVDWDKTASEIGKFVDAMGGVQGVAVAIAAITFAGPIGGVLSLIASLVTLTTATIPAVITALGALASAPVMAGIMALLFPKELNTGEDDYLKGKRGATWDGDPVGQQRAAANSNDAALADRQRYLLSRLKTEGYTDAQSAGIVGSLMQEDSTLDPSKVNPKSGAAGFGQWLGPRAKAFEKMFGHSVSQGTFGEQTDFMLWELKNIENDADKRIRNSGSAADTAAVHARFYERPGAAEMNVAQRQAYANSLFAKPPGAQVAQAAAQQPDQSVQVDVHLHNAPAGTQATASVRNGAGKATARVGTSNVTGPPV